MPNKASMITSVWIYSRARSANRKVYQLLNYLSIWSVAAILVLPVFAISANAHSDGLNSQGCHAGSKPYHCHRSASEMVQNNSGGNRLRCNAGSRSNDCRGSTNNQDSSPLIRFKYVCNGETHIIVSTEAGWALLKQPNVEVSTTYDGFMLVNRETGIKKSLGKSSSGGDVMYIYHEENTKRYVCVYDP